MTDNWQSLLYDGLLVEKGKKAPVYTGMITKPNADKQLSEIQHNELMVDSNNTTMRGIKNRYKNKTLAHRAMSFLPQE